MKSSLEEILIAPCGMNCALCAGYLAHKNKLREKGMKIIVCAGCRIRDKRCAYLRKHCIYLSKNKITYCFECPDFPCHNLRTIDQRYRKRYRMSMIENLKEIKKNGIQNFLKHQEKKWQCSECKEVICCHNGLCFHCQLSELKRKKKKYRWSEE